MSLHDGHDHTPHPNCPSCIDGMTPAGINPDLGPVLRLCPAQTVGVLTYTGTGWQTLGDAPLANTAAVMARARHETGREELAHEIGSSPLSSSMAA